MEVALPNARNARKKKSNTCSSPVLGKDQRLYLLNTITLFHLGRLAWSGTLVLSLSHCPSTNASIYRIIIWRACLVGEMKSTGGPTLFTYTMPLKSLQRLELMAKSVSVGEFLLSCRSPFYFSPIYSFEEDEDQTEAVSCPLMSSLPANPITNPIALLSTDGNSNTRLRK